MTERKDGMPIDSRLTPKSAANGAISQVCSGGFDMMTRSMLCCTSQCPCHIMSMT